MQSRFAQRQPKRVFRLMTHPRFRAAFDFLDLRLTASDEHAADVEFWRNAQNESREELAEHFQAHAETDGDADGPRKRRRRRRAPASGE